LVFLHIVHEHRVPGRHDVKPRSIDIFLVEARAERAENDSPFPRINGEKGRTGEYDEQDDPNKNKDESGQKLFSLKWSVFHDVQVVV